MTAHVALLRAINVGGTGALPMAVLSALCADLGFDEVQTYIASGNVVFHSDWPEDRIRSTLADRLDAHMGRPIGVLVRTAAEIAGVVARNPFPDAPGNRTVALFVDGPMPPDPADGAVGLRDEQIRCGLRELFIHYPQGQARTRLRLPSEQQGTARNMNTVAKLAAMAAAPT